MPEFKFDLFDEKNQPLTAITCTLTPTLLSSINPKNPLVLDLWGYNNHDIIINFDSSQISSTGKITLKTVHILSNNFSNIRFNITPSATSGKTLEIIDLKISNADITYYGTTTVNKLTIVGDVLRITPSTNVLQTLTVENEPDPDDQVITQLLKGAMLIPGSGKNCYGKSALQHLDALRTTFPNMEWIAPVVAWFGTSMNAAECLVMPGIEDSRDRVEPSWNKTHTIAKDSGKLRYGGTPSDASIISYLKHAKKLGYKVMLNPMLFMDVPGKEWRGNLTCAADGVDKFFVQYQRFILHYANLCKSSNIEIDAFLIGSELKKMTAIYIETTAADGTVNREFPFSTKLIQLAAEVKKLLPNTKLSYAADWSEYHHTDNGWRNLDPLWASPHIDFVGIDNYAPITATKAPRASLQEIKYGLVSGDQYDCYYNGYIKHDMPAEWGNKAFKVWWENKHFNPNGQQTPWVPSSKKIWFTEFGFPSIGMAANQPNVFYNPECKDAGIPKHSHSYQDNRIQRLGVRAILECIQSGGIYGDFVEQAFLYCLDTRGLHWQLDMSMETHTPKWADAHLYAYGHWCDGKIAPPLRVEYVADIAHSSVTDVTVVTGIRDSARRHVEVNSAMPLPVLFSDASASTLTKPQPLGVPVETRQHIEGQPSESHTTAKAKQQTNSLRL